MAPSRGLVAACAAVIAIVLVGDVAAAVVVTNRNRVHTPAALRKVLPDLKRFVERTRQLSFKRGIDVFVLEDQEFEAATSDIEPGATDPASRYEESRFLVGFLMALGLVGRDFQLSSLEEAGRDSLLGLYDIEEKRILVRKELPEPLLRRVLVHELTHALDDQHFPLENVQVDLRTEQFRALQALVEGDAERVDALYRDQLPSAEQVAANVPVEGLAGVPATAEPFLELLAFPYVAGPGLVRALVERDGEAAVNAAFRKPPTTSEEVLHPARFLDGAREASVPRPSADGPLLGLGVLGELVLRLVLGETLAAAAANQAADGWGGDSYVAWSDDERSCVRVNLAMDSPRDTSEVRDGLRQWARTHPGADVRLNGDLTTITRCA